MARAFLFILDSVGIGGAPDAAAFSDEGSNTIGHIAEACAKGDGDKERLRSGYLHLPFMDRLGLGTACKLATGTVPSGLQGPEEAMGLWGLAEEVSKGKDTPSGHWEIAGVPVTFDWGYFAQGEEVFPQDMLDAIYADAGIEGAIALKSGSGTEIIAEFGEEHIKTSLPIFYTSADSVLQIAAHEEHFGLERLYALCETAFKHTEPLNIGRVIARPFVGEDAASFERTGNRRDYSIKPPEPTLLDRAKEAGRNVFAVGKISDIYAHQGVTHVRKVSGNEALMDATLQVMDEAKDGDLAVTNFVDFDQLYGHRRDVPGYAAALEHFDRRMEEVTYKMRDDDLVILTADHGCDPTWRGTDHTRECVPILAFGRQIKSGTIGRRKTFADIGESIADWLDLPSGPHGVSFLDGVTK